VLVAAAVPVEEVFVVADHGGAFGVDGVFSLVDDVLERHSSDSDDQVEHDDLDDSSHQDEIRLEEPLFKATHPFCRFKEVSVLSHTAQIHVNQAFKELDAFTWEHRICCESAALFQN